MSLSRYKVFIVVLIISVVAFSVVLPTIKPIIQQNQIAYIIDAGHGLPDGGAVGVDGTSEQLLNLTVLPQKSW